MAEIIYPELSFKIVGLLFSVYNELGPDYQEKYYQKAIAKALEESMIKFERERLVSLQYHSAVIGRHFLDFIIDDKIIREIKRVNRLLPNDFRQILAYLKSTNKKLGILANFSREGLEYKRIVNRDYSGVD